MMMIITGTMELQKQQKEITRLERKHFLLLLQMCTKMITSIKVGWLDAV